MASWQLYIRHAHRDTSDRSLDNGLSEKGRRQGQELAKHLKAHKLVPERVYSSPKARCQETADYVARLADTEVEIDDRLDEQRDRESGKEFERRVADFLKQAVEQSGVAYCSHGDWLQVAARLTGAHDEEPKKGDFFEVREGKLIVFNALRG